MAASGTSKFGPPKIPDTPSNTINTMLKQRCGKEYDNVVKAGLAFYICYIFQGITMVYKAIHKDSNPSHRMWMISCGLISAAIILKSYLIYNIIMACSFLMYGVLYYGSVLVALFGIGLGVSGMVFFDKEGAGSATSSGTSTYSYQRSSTTKKDF